MEQLIKVNASVETVSTINGKTGSNTVRVMRAAEFKDVYKASKPDASNREVKKAYEAHYRDMAAKMAAGFDFQKAIALAQAGALGIERVTANKDGDKSTIVFVDLSEAKPSVVEAKKALDGLDNESLKALFEYVATKLA